MLIQLKFLKGINRKSRVNTMILHWSCESVQYALVLFPYENELIDVGHKDSFRLQLLLIPECVHLEMN